MVTSPDMEPNVAPIMHLEKVEQIPPVLPFLINLLHTECYVKADGKVRIDGQWVDVRNLYGVMEEHSGQW